MSEEQFRCALEAVRRGRFKEVRNQLESLGFEVKDTSDPNHVMYYHPLLREDPHFRYPRNLYRPHGPRRSADRISKLDQSQAKQMIEALKAVIASQEATEVD